MPELVASCRGARAAIVVAIAMASMFTGCTKRPAVTSTGESGSASPPTVRAAVVTLGSHDEGDFVGVHFTADEIHRMIPLLEVELGSDRDCIVVLRVDSGGGFLSEIEPIAAAVEDLKRRWRVVAWIDTAISAAAMSLHGVSEIYFLSDGHYGRAGPGWNDPRSDTRAWLAVMEQISALGGHDPLIMRAMMNGQPLSISVSPDGSVQYFANDTVGQILVNRRGDVLTLNSDLAETIGFASGTADTLEELERALGSGRVNWIGTQHSAPWPECRAERWNKEWRREVGKRERELETALANALFRLDIAQKARPGHRSQEIERAAQAIDDLERLALESPAPARLVLGLDKAEVPEWIRRKRQELENLETELPTVQRGRTIP